MFGNQGQAAQTGTQTAIVSNTFTAAGTSAQTATLPGAAVGTPLAIVASGSVSGYVTLNVGNLAAISVPVNPNAPFTRVQIPRGAFLSKVGSVSLTLGADGAGTIRAIVSFSA